MNKASEAATTGAANIPRTQSHLSHKMMNNSSYLSFNNVCKTVSVLPLTLVQLCITYVCSNSPHAVAALNYG